MGQRYQCFFEEWIVKYYINIIPLQFVVGKKYKYNQTLLLFGGLTLSIYECQIINTHGSEHNNVWIQNNELRKI